MPFDYQGARAAGYSDEEIQKYLASLQATPTPTTPPPTQQPTFVDNTPAVQQDSNLTKLGKFGVNMAQTMIKPVVGYGKNVGEAVYQTGRLATSPAHLKATLGMDLSPEEAQKISSGRKTLFLNEDDVKDRKSIVTKVAKDTAGTMAFAIPGGKGVQAVKGAAVSGALSGLAHSQEGKELEGVMSGATIGALFGVGGQVLSKACGRLKGVGKIVDDDITAPVTSKNNPLGAIDEEKMGQTAREFGFTGSGANRRQQAAQLFEKLSKDLKSVLDKSNNHVGTDPLKKRITTALQETGEYFVPDDPTHAKELERVLKLLDKQSEQGTLSAASIQKLKSELGSGLSRAFRKVSGDLDSDLTVREGVKMDVWRLLDDLISEVEPNAKEITTQMSKLYELAPGLYKSAKAKGGLGFGQVALPVPNRIMQGMKSGVANVSNAVGGALAFSPGAEVRNAAIAGTTSALAQEPQPQEPTFLDDVPAFDTQETETTGATVTGNTVEEHYQALANATMAGDTAAQKEIKKLLDIETDYQETQGGKEVKKTELDKKFAFAGQEATKALQLLDTVDSGKIASLKSKVGEFFDTQDPNVTRFKSQAAIARTALMNALLGANMSPAEIERIADFVFDYSQEPKILKERLSTFVNSMNDYQTNISGNGADDPLSFSNEDSTDLDF